MDAAALRVVIDDQETSVFPIVDENGARVRQGNGYAYSTPDGSVVTLVFADDASPGGDHTQQDKAPEMESSIPGPELWPLRKTRFLIGKYKELKELVGKKGGFR
ncbi:uncharacterized protein LOC144123023 [Amblyomma americanum]